MDIQKSSLDLTLKMNIHGDDYSPAMMFSPFN